MFVGITNRMGLPVLADRVSRGTLVTWALRQASAAALHEALQALPGDRHNPFHLFYADATGAFVTGSDGFRVWHRSLAPGLHVVTQQDVDSTGGRFDIVAEAMRRREPWDVPQLETLLREHREDPREAICVHAPGGVRYGTRSSAIVVLERGRGASRFFWAEGAPCTHPREDFSALVNGGGV
jgi:hypothetical protein